MKDKRISPMQALKLKHAESEAFVDHTTAHSTHSKKLIAWEKWLCPFGTDLGDTEWPGAISPPTVDGSEPEFDEDDIDKEVQLNLGKGTPLIQTPFGVIPVTEQSNPGKVFNFWNGFTNFRINHDIRKMIEDVSGVETLDIWTPYRFRLGIGRLFDSIKVRHEVDNRLNEYFKNRETSLWAPLKLSGEMFLKKAN